MQIARQIVQRARCAAVATDSHNRILSCNPAARELTGLGDGAEIAGRGFYELLEARDPHGNRLDPRHLAFEEMVSFAEPVQGFEILIRKAGGDSLPVAVSVIVVAAETGPSYQLVYLLRPVYRRRKADEVIARLLADPTLAAAIDDRRPKKGRGASLTPRQTEVLGLLARGLSPGEIARSLGVSPHTVRSHIHDLFDKLGVHSQVEAVARAFRDRLI